MQFKIHTKITLSNYLSFFFFYETNLHIVEAMIIFFYPTLYPRDKGSFATNGGHIESDISNIHSFVNIDIVSKQMREYRYFDI